MIILTHDIIIEYSETHFIAMVDTEGDTIEEDVKDLIAAVGYKSHIRRPDGSRYMAELKLLVLLIWYEKQRQTAVGDEISECDIDIGKELTIC